MRAWINDTINIDTVQDIVQAIDMQLVKRFAIFAGNNRVIRFLFIPGDRNGGTIAGKQTITVKQLQIWQ